MEKNIKRSVELKYFFWAFFYFHLALYVASNILLIASNFLTSPNQLWFIIPLASWGVWVFAHFFITFFMISDSAKEWRNTQIKKEASKEEGLDELAARKKASTKFFFWMLFYFHLAVFIGGNTVMTLINIIVDREQLWFFIPLVGWGLWLLFHYFLTYLCLGDQVKKWRESKLRKLSFSELSKDISKQEITRDAFIRFFAWNLFFLHFVLYILCNLMMVGINFMMSKENLWFVWPLFAWGIFLLAHFGLTYVTASSLMVRWREKQLAKITDS
jgi:2TM domain-containing protein